MADSDIIQCTTSELRAAMRDAQASAVAAFITDSNLRVRGQTCYYSTIRFQLQATEIAPGTYTLSLSAQERQAFSYSLGQSMSAAGFVPPTGLPNSSAVAASLTQTNLSQPKSTRNGERFIITGISAFLDPVSDHALAGWIWSHASVQLVKNDTLRSPLGPLNFFPALSSINGNGLAPNMLPAENARLAEIAIPRQSEGTTRSFDLSAAPIVWMPQGQTDGSLFLAVALDEPYSETISSRAAGPGINAWSPIAAANSAPNGPAVAPVQIRPGSYVDIIFRLDGTSEALMSQNQGA